MEAPSARRTHAATGLTTAEHADLPTVTPTAQDGVLAVDACLRADTPSRPPNRPPASAHDLDEVRAPSPCLRRRTATRVGVEPQATSP